MHQIEFYFDCSSPWTYLCFEHALRLFANRDVEFVWKPILVGGLFNTINPSVYHTREHPVTAKVEYQKKDLQDWASFVGIEIGSPPVFPVNSVNAMRGAFVAIEQNCLIEYARCVFKTYWGDLKDISQASVLEQIVEQVGLDLADFREKITDVDYKDMLRATTKELANRGGFGSPTLFLDRDDMYFGNDRLALIDAKIKK